MLPKHEKKAYIQVREEEIRKKWVNYQEGESLQQTFTPLSLTYEMLQKLPSLEGKDVLVVANIETVLFLSTLKRDGHVNFNKLHFLTDIKKLEGKEGVSYISFDELDKVDLGMKFDVVIGNPPYSTGLTKDKFKHGGLKHRTTSLYDKFVTLGLDLLTEDGTVAMVIPSKWCSRPELAFSKLATKKLSYIKDTSAFFNVAIDTCYIVLDNEEGDVVINNTKVETIPAFIPIKCIGKEIELVIKLNAFASPKLGSIHEHVQLFNRKELGNGCTPIIEITGRSGAILHTNTVEIDNSQLGKFKHFNKWKAVTNSIGGKGSIGTVKIGKPGYVTSTGIVSFGAETEKEAMNIKRYLDSKFITFLVSKYKIMAANSKAIFDQIPLMDMEIPASDENIYRYFNLTQEEIDLIESSVK